ncbi:nucleotide exchange factor GrpE [Candidatus Parcubacteria bacterium]|nr:nucleotide exchange factor GrpE [Candidatus Parcubacteria bacterium]
MHDDKDIEIDEEFVPEDGEGNTEDTVKSLRVKLKKALAEKQEYLDGWQRAKADFINSRKRDEETRKAMMKFAAEDLVLQIVPVLDSFTMAFNNKEAWEKVDKNWRIGVEHIYSQLLGVLQQNGFSEFNPMGETFDPMKHNAVETVPVTEKEKNHKVVEVLQKGYILHGKIIRPASVKIGELKHD